MQCGIDIIDIVRIEKAIEKEHFFNKVFTPYEREYINSKMDRPATAAGIFCAKEAYVKATGTGITKDCFGDIEITHTENGKPIINKIGCSVSISHTQSTATAIVIIE